MPRPISYTAPLPIDDDGVRVFHEGARTVWQHEVTLLQQPSIDIHRFTYTAGGGTPPAIIQSQTLFKSALPAAVQDFETEVIANSGGLILPTDREVVIYDYQPDYYDVIEWPSGSGNLFSIAKMNFIPYSGRCEIQIRSQNILQGIVYRQCLTSPFDAASWSITPTYNDIVIPAMVDELRAREQNLFYGRITPEDKSFFILANFLSGMSGLFKPSTADRIVDMDGLDWRIKEWVYDSREKYFNVVAHRTTESDPET